MSTPSEMRQKWVAYGERLKEGDGVEGSLFGAAFIIARSGVTDVLALLDQAEYTDTDEELAMAIARLKEAEALLRRWVAECYGKVDIPLKDDTEAFL